MAVGLIENLERCVFYEHAQFQRDFFKVSKRDASYAVCNQDFMIYIGY